MLKLSDIGCWFSRVNGCVVHSSVVAVLFIVRLCCVSMIAVSYMYFCLLEFHPFANLSW